jgi:hypothetical protein
MLVQITVAVLAGFLGGLLQGYILRPIRDYRQARKKIAKDLIKYGHLISSPGSGYPDKMDEAKYELRDDAAELRATIEDIPGHRILSLFIVPSESTLQQVEGRLIRLSNSVHSGDVSRNNRDRRKVRDLLHIGSRNS